MIAEASRALPNETGGILLGYWSPKEDQVVIIVSTRPGPRAHHDLVKFVPDDEYQEHEIERVYAESGRRHVYLGDWHSHPDGEAALSRQDRKTLRAIAAHRAACLRHPLMGILAGGRSWDLKIWKFVPPPFPALPFLARTAALHVREYYEEDSGRIT